MIRILDGGNKTPWGTPNPTYLIKSASLGFNEVQSYIENIVNPNKLLGSMLEGKLVEPYSDIETMQCRANHVLDLMECNKNSIIVPSTMKFSGDVNFYRLYEDRNGGFTLFVLEDLPENVSLNHNSRSGSTNLVFYQVKPNGWEVSGKCSFQSLLNMPREIQLIARTQNTMLWERAWASYDEREKE